MIKLFERSVEIKNELKAINIPFKEKILKALAAFIITALILIGPFVFLVNCTIYNDYRKYIICGIIFLFFLFDIIFNIIYHNGLNEKGNVNLKDLIISNIIADLIVYFIICIIFLVIGGIA